jgi:hypothetical protein
MDIFQGKKYDSNESAQLSKELCTEIVSISLTLVLAQISACWYQQSCVHYCLWYQQSCVHYCLLLTCPCVHWVLGWCMSCTHRALKLAHIGLCSGMHACLTDVPPFRVEAPSGFGRFLVYIYGTRLCTCVYATPMCIPCSRIMSWECFSVRAWVTHANIPSHTYDFLFLSRVCHYAWFVSATMLEAISRDR